MIWIPKRDPRPKTTTRWSPAKHASKWKKNLIRASAHRKYVTDIVDYETKNPFDKDETTIQKFQKDFADINELMEHQRGELASFYHCPNPDCHAFNRIPDLIQPAVGVLSWDIIRGPDFKKPAPKTTNPNQSKSKKQTDKGSFPSQNITKKLKISDHPTSGQMTPSN
ncbi:hypothetical protein TNCT_243701 [Trichonephila clavata]|uniref:Uncharacterized protein n=1 Tax=Trichonephila clavata TaxID=2740835 RepID=A0A8X6KAE5_TRICU|nr:hypothetical protein TNCT_243701 [Trichonephila clavata]